MLNSAIRPTACSAIIDNRVALAAAGELLIRPPEVQRMAPLDGEDSDIVDALPVDEDDLPVADLDHTDAIETTVRLLLEFDTEPLADTTARLVRTGIDRTLALRLILLIPIAWGRFILQASGVHILTDEYHLLDRQTRNRTKKRLSDDALYQQIRDALPTAMMRYHPRHFTGLARRSTEVAAVKKLLRDGARPGGVVLGPLTLVWPPF